MPTTLAALAVLIFLLPGFVTDRIIVSLTPQRSRTDFRLVIDSLVWAFVDEVFYRIIALPFGLQQFPMGFTPEHPEVLFEGHALSAVILLLTSLVVGLIWSALSVWGVVFWLLRLIKITRSSGRVDVWQDVFTKHRTAWLRAYLQDGTTITGWPEYFSDDGDKREVFLADAFIERPIDKDSGAEADDDTVSSITELQGPGILLTERAEIVYVEVLPHDVASSEREEETDEHEETNASASNRCDGNGRSRR
ncbi:DUF6338 family protein [Acetobacter thailandicus]|uniref:DUF6338 family protein n=1 Tax=Acetobacter thailandicus TaxID=1502842 RepID=UPI001BAC88C7|nr:DUF6338 family protein [Acetobacter thailandicus]MBS0986908.1 hypothetical protein [Acetobacter thailandicus]